MRRLWHILNKNLYAILPYCILCENKHQFIKHGLVRHTRTRGARLSLWLPLLGNHSGGEDSRRAVLGTLVVI